jgi:integrase
MREALSKDELKALLERAKASRERDWLMILVGYWHGLRASEVVGLKRDDVQDGYIIVQRLKRSALTTQPLMEDPDPLFNERAGMFDFVQFMTRDERIFPVSRIQFYRLFRRYANQAGIPRHKQHPHVLKHSIAMQTIHSAGIENVRQWLGHRSMASTGEYLKVSDEQSATAIKEASRTIQHG